jgi:putative transcriptional regulator
MRPIQIIRVRLGVTQVDVAEAMGCTQPNITYYERGGRIPQDRARKLIEFARGKGLPLTFDHVYGAEDVPHLAGVGP